MSLERSAEPAPPRIGIVLSSGGVRGVYAHTGFLQAIEALRIPVSASAGCSAGALVGGFIASGTPLEAWAEALKKIDSHSFWRPDSLLRFLWKMLAGRGRGYAGLSDTEAALQFTRDHVSARRFEDCLYPFHVLAVNLGSGKKKVFSSGELAPRMTASAAMPILYRPVRIDGEFYCDGALIDFAPTDAICCRHRLDVVIVHHVSQQFGIHRELDAALDDDWAMLEVVNRLVFRVRPWYLTGEPLSMQYCPCGCGAIIIAIEPDLPRMRWPDTRGGDVAQARALQQTQELLRPHLDAMLDDPRRRLPVCAAPLQAPASGCGVHDPST